MSIDGAYVVACCPARNRLWSLPGWAGAMYHQTRQPDNTFILLNDCTDGSATALEMVKQAGGWLGDYEVLNTGVAGDNRINPRYSTANLAALRNATFAAVVERWPNVTHIWSCDSDVLPDANVLELLIAADLPIVSAVVRNSPAVGVYNFWCGRSDDTPLRTPCGGSEVKALRNTKPQVVTMTGACTLYRRDVVNRIKFADHPQGEDVAFSINAHRAGFMLAVHPLARTKHVQPTGEEWR